MKDKEINFFETKNYRDSYAQANFGESGIKYAKERQRKKYLSNKRKELQSID